MLTSLDVEDENVNIIMRSIDYLTLNKCQYGSTPPPMAGGALELEFPKYQKTLDNHFLKPILRPDTSVFNKLNLSLVIWTSL